MAGFVIQYNRKTGERRLSEFPGKLGHREALRYRLKLEAERKTSDWEIVSLNSESREAIEKTHARYFQSREVMS